MWSEIVESEETENTTLQRVEKTDKLRCIGTSQESLSEVSVRDQLTQNSPRRLRSRSGRAKRDPDFVYDDNITNKVKKYDLKERSASCSNLNFFVEPQPLRKTKKNKQDISDKREKKFHNSVNTSVNSVNARSKSDKELEVWCEKQSKLRQQRIDILLINTTASSALSEKSLFRTVTQADLSDCEANRGDKKGEDPHNSQNSIVDSFVSTSEYLNPDTTATDEQWEVNNQSSNMSEPKEIQNSDVQNKADSGRKPNKSVTGTGTPDTQPNDDWKEFFLKIKAEINENTKATVEALRSYFTTGLAELKVSQEKVQTD